MSLSDCSLFCYLVLGFLIDSVCYVYWKPHSFSGLRPVFMLIYQLSISLWTDSVNLTPMSTDVTGLRLILHLA